MVSVIAWTKSLIVDIIKLTADEYFSFPRDINGCCGRISRISTSKRMFLKDVEITIFCFYRVLPIYNMVKWHLLQLFWGPPNGPPIRSVKHRV